MAGRRGTSTPAPRVEVRRSARRRRTASARREGDTIVVLLPAALSAAEERRTVDLLVGRVLAREARAVAPGAEEDLASRARALADRYLAVGLPHPPRPGDVRWVGNQLRRWGSCSVGSRVIRLSDRLRPMPSWVVDYVLVHELAHLVHADHSAEFWRLVDRYPRAERARGYLLGWSAAAGLEVDDHEASDADEPPTGPGDVDPGD